MRPSEIGLPARRRRIGAEDERRLGREVAARRGMEIELQPLGADVDRDEPPLAEQSPCISERATSP